MVKRYETPEFDISFTSSQSPEYVRALPLSPDGQQALDDMLADAWDEGWEACVRDNHIDTLTPNPYRKDKKR